MRWGPSCQMARIEIYITTSVANDVGTIRAIDDLAMCFVEDSRDPEEVEETAMAFLAAHCSAMAEMGYDVRYCVGIVYINKKSVMSLSYIDEDISENVIPLHSPDWERPN